MRRIFLLFLLLFITVFFGWWIYVPLVILYAYLVKTPYELIVTGFLLDYIYHFGNTFVSENVFLIISTIIVFISVYLSDKLDWKKTI